MKPVTLLKAFTLALLLTAVLMRRIALRRWQAGGRPVKVTIR